MRLGRAPWQSAFSCEGKEAGGPGARSPRRWATGWARAAARAGVGIARPGRAVRRDSSSVQRSDRRAVAGAPIGDSRGARSMKTFERSGRRGSIQSSRLRPAGPGLGQNGGLRAALSLQPAADDAVGGNPPASTSPTHSGWYTLPFLNMPHNVAARPRARLRRALRNVIPASRCS